jgi:glycine cleavage system H protein
VPDYLEATFDKFTFRVATDRLYSPEGVWVQTRPDGQARVGVTDFLQQHSGDVAFVSVKAPGTKVGTGDEFAEMETMKMTLSLIAPIAGAVIEVNPALELTPEVVNQDPYGQGWLALLEPASWATEKTRLLDAQAYFALMKSQVEQERLPP